MSIKFRLLLSYIALLLVPTLLTVIVGIFAGFYYMEDFYKDYPGVGKIHTLRQGMIERERFFSHIKKISLRSPDDLEDERFLKKIEQQLIGFNTGLIVRKNHEIIYSSKILQQEVKKVVLPQFGEYAYDRAIFLEKGSSDELRLSQQDFYFSDKTEGSVFLITNIEPMKKAFQEIVSILTITIVVILIITNGTLTYLVAGSIVKPLNKLKDSANRIKEGDLDFEVISNTRDEIGELSRAFEEMRKRLKYSLDKQLQYEENRKELFSNISHDLKTPITTIKGYVEGIRDGVADTPEKMEKYIHRIYTKAVDIDRLIDDLFLFSKLDLNKFPLHLSSIDVTKYFLDLVEELQFDLEKEKMTIKYHYKIDAPVFVIVDVMQIKRVIVNIIENAVKYTDKPEGIIDIMLEENKDQVQIEIKDTGQGISKEALPFIFDRFYRADPSRNALTGGSGLGLSIAKKIIEEHGGTMWAESAEGIGTSIFFTLKKHRSGDIE
ncbi:HAMP domain-containing sensor histidine kinase [Clostridium formicaceticum]|uniref:histidine kinase n=1 Tax=Clostridium formicaceticum TaxID=1497 RepID=A0AAC9RPS9_9CLOT|nr:HAMP domain-containing sensor histidine kinase [Clostridium formicaceticum]AOY78127.1 hypothetical protein BJL90_21035 [Clostridium formicaceticum]ARE88778.1 Sensor histidine kinase YycG [Clostridium formicaceticum]